MRELVKGLEDQKVEKEITTWNENQIPKAELYDTWVLLEERIDQAIDERLSSVLQNWEVRRKHFFNAEEKIMLAIKESYGYVLDRLEDLEKTLRSATGSDTSYDDKFKRSISLQGEMQGRNKDFKVEVAHEFGFEQRGILRRLLTNPAALFRVESRKKQYKKDAVKYHKNKVQFMKDKAKLVLDRMKDSDETLRQLVQKQMDCAEANTKTAYRETSDLLQSNKSLLEELAKERRNGKEIYDTYKPLATELDAILEDTIGFGYKNIVEYDFPEGSLSPYQGDVQMRDNSKMSMLTSLHKVQDANKKQFFMKVIAKNSAFKRRHLYFIARNLR